MHHCSLSESVLLRPGDGIDSFLAAARVDGSLNCHPGGGRGALGDRVLRVVCAGDLEDRAVAAVEDLTGVPAATLRVNHRLVGAHTLESDREQVALRVKVRPLVLDFAQVEYRQRGHDLDRIVMLFVGPDTDRVSRLVGVAAWPLFVGLLERDRPVR